MKEKLKSKLSLSALILASVWLVFYFGLGAVIFRNMWYTSPALPIVGGIFAFIPLTAEILNLFVFKKKWLDVAVIILSPALWLAHFFFFLFVLSKLTYFFTAGTPYFITAGLIGLIAFFVFAFPRLNKLWKRITATALSVIIGIICLVCLFDATPFYIDGGATVFAVDGEYQIAFSTSHKSTGFVEVNGKTYCDQTNGENEISKLHKISVPAGELDLAKKYSIRTQSVAINTAYLPSKGAVIEKQYSFRPVTESDGIQIYNLSDTHECIAGPANAGSYFGDKLDLLILNGDIINDVSSEYRISLIYKLAHRITGGSVPVIYSRGNHECNGSLSSAFGKFVGCADRGFYYTYKIGTTLSLLVLDTANDMSDDSAFISPVANFNEVRKAESEWIKSLGAWCDCENNIIVAHMPYPLSGYAGKWNGWAKELIELTSGKADFALCGHSHKTIFTPDGTDDNAIADYPVVRGSIRSDRYADKEGVSPFEFTGTAIEIKDGKITVKFTNSNKQVLNSFTV